MAWKPPEKSDDWCRVLILQEEPNGMRLDKAMAELNPSEDALERIWKVRQESHSEKTTRLSREGSGVALQ